MSKFKNPDIRRSELKKYEDTMMADMGLQSLDELTPEEKKRWKKALRPSKSVQKKLREMGYSLNSNNNKRSLGSNKDSRLLALARSLEAYGFSVEAGLVDRLIKIATIPGISHPSDEVEIAGVNNAIKHIKENPGLTLHLDNPVGTFKWSVDGEPKPMPFHYGEIIEANNPSDDMGWDVVIAPEATGESKELDGVHYVPAGHNLEPVGYVPVNPDEDTWRKNTSSPSNPDGKLPSRGNDKIILAPEGKINPDDAKEIEDFFGQIWNFNKIVWL